PQGRTSRKKAASSAESDLPAQPRIRAREVIGTSRGLLGGCATDESRTLGGPDRCRQSRAGSGSPQDQTAAQNVGSAAWQPGVAARDLRPARSVARFARSIPPDRLKRGSGG